MVHLMGMQPLPTGPEPQPPLQAAVSMIHLCCALAPVITAQIRKLAPSQPPAACRLSLTPETSWRVVCALGPDLLEQLYRQLLVHLLHFPSATLVMHISWLSLHTLPAQLWDLHPGGGDPYVPQAGHRHCALLPAGSRPADRRHHWHG